VFPGAPAPPGTIVDPRRGRGSPGPAGPRRGARLWRFAVGALGAAAIAVGVYEIATSGHSTAIASVGLGKAAFIQQADAICTRLNPVVDAEIQRLVADYELGDQYGVRAEDKLLATSANELITELSALGLPSTGAATVRALLNDYGQLVGALLTNTGEGLAAAEVLGERIGAQATEFGFHVCGAT
jgi:hypothetical protein